MVRPTEKDQERLTPAQLDALRCPACRGMLVKPLTKSIGALVCPVAGHTGLMAVSDDSSTQPPRQGLQSRFMAVSPKALARYDPRRIEYDWNYAIKRCEEHWQEPEQLEAAKALMKKRKGKKP